MEFIQKKSADSAVENFLAKAAESGISLVWDRYEGQPATGPTLRSLAELQPTTLAVMHGSSFRGDGAAALRAVADGYDGLFAQACRRQ